MGFFDKLKKINIFASFGSELNDDFYDELEESLILADTGMGSSRQSAPSSASAALWQGLAPSGSSARSSAQVRTLCPSASSSPASRACLPSPPHKAKIIKVHAPFSIYSMQLPLAGAAGMVYTYFI